MSVIDFRPKGARTRKVPIEEALKAFLDQKPRTMLLIGTTGDDLIVYSGGERCSEVLWLLELAKRELLDGEWGGG